MSSLTEAEKRYLEHLLDMSGGYVLKEIYNDETYGALFSRYGVDIHRSPKYHLGGSKAKKLRAFWEQEPDDLVADILGEMVASYQASCELGELKLNRPVLDKTLEIIARLKGKKPQLVEIDTEGEFLNQEFSIPNIEKLPIEAAVSPIIRRRLDEARAALQAGANLSVIFLCGSVLEGVLLGAAQSNPARFNVASASPRYADGKVKSFQDWSLAQFIDVACEIGILKPDVKKFSHGLRDFRNYIHPYQELASGFTPDQHTAKVCFQVLKAALASVVGER